MTSAGIAETTFACNTREFQILLMTALEVVVRRNSILSLPSHN